MAKYQIKIEKGNRKQIVVEPISSIDNNNQAENNPLFHEEYLKAKKILDSFTKDVSINKNDDSKSDDKKSDDHKNYGHKNNIIVFTGDRGTGKTSAMVSFGEYLKERGIKTSDRSDEKAAGCKLLDMIDPSYFRKNESILLNVITLMFKMAKEHNEKCNSKYREDCDKYKDEKSSGYDFNNLLKEFEKVFRSVKRMDSTVPKEDSLEYLNELSDAIDLNKSIHGLIKFFLEFFKDGSKYLVLMIDDLDMNVAYAATMLEQIRKFLIQDNVIILIATNVDQLQFEMKEYYSKYYDKTLQPTQQNASISVDVEDMATMYLLKLFPPLQRIHISDAANKLIETELNVKVIKKKEGNSDFNGDLQKTILNLIWKKTRLIFIPEKDQLHPIIPTNLRALHQFIYLLLDMKDATTPQDKEPQENNNNPQNPLFKSKDEYDTVHENFKIFKDYILNVWIPSNVSFEEQKVFDNIPKDISRINKHLIQSINIIGSKYKKSILIKEIDSNLLDDKVKKNFDRDTYTFVSPNDPKFSHANKISDVINFPSNNAAGDILLLIDKYKTYFEAANLNNFIDAVKIYYSLLLFETMFFKSTVKEINNGLNNYKIDDVKNISNIQRLIGGTLFFPHYFTIVKSSDYEELKEKKKKEEDKLIKDPDDPAQKSSPSDVKRIIEEGRNKSSENHLFYHSFKDVDAKALFYIVYYGGKRPERSFGIQIYDTKAADVEKETVYKYRFDILSLLVNVLNPYQTLARFVYSKKKCGQDIKFLHGRVNKWNEFNMIDDKFLPNSILPIYSVDLMLKYLKKQFDVSEIDSDFQEITDPRGKFVEKFVKKLKENLLNAQSQGLLKELDNSVESTLKEPEYQKIEKLKERLKERLKDKDEERLKEELKAKTEEELKEFFWGIDIMELMEREARDINFISNYYKELNKLTNKALGQIEFKEEISQIYNAIYKKGCKCFIKERTENDSTK